MASEPLSAGPAPILRRLLPRSQVRQIAAEHSRARALCCILGGMSVAALGRDERHPALDANLFQLISKLDGGAPAVQINWRLDSARGDTIRCLRLKDTRWHFGRPRCNAAKLNSPHHPRRRLQMFSAHSLPVGVELGHGL